ncbi:nucleotide pyrophosphohydrolase [Ammoniphilus sp. CFH 90114]|uniref:nucleotide pyrophosphohydrolase n=1 Tax=Ammoniphilus sp. CFH 90114 TaxID=2493665 RepID=UPI00100E4641|nr:nucleotide pyrophosphohydrolase [Ammoniphilus sp. CFH 90114]RXT01546.1 nucleotide pyrophosphohydrolase [Ammoniphilus sp. CFH 90114]
MEDIISKLIEFRKERDWEQFHTPKDLAISISLEASELLENFQWKDSQNTVEQNLPQIKEELADVLIYAMYLAHDLNIDIKEAIQSKIEKNKEKYPVGKAFGSNKKYSEL